MPPVVELATVEQRYEAIRALQRIINDPTTTPEDQIEAEERLLAYAEEITEWMRPTGFRLLIFLPYPATKTESGRVVLPEKAAAEYGAATQQAYVLALGPLAYADKERFGQPWCKVGDRIVMRAYSGTRFRRAGGLLEYALINDDTVEAVIGDKDIKIERP